jgi:hypothetical protein
MKLGRTQDHFHGVLSMVGFSEHLRYVWASKPHGPGGAPMVPSLTTILPRLTGEWATLLQPAAIRAGRREMG